MIWKVLVWALLTTFVVSGARAYDLDEVQGILCNTKDQATQFVALGANPAAAHTINADAHQIACALAEVRYIRGQTISIHNASIGLVEVVEILVVAVKFRGRWGEVAAGLQYVVLELKGGGA